MIVVLWTDLLVYLLVVLISGFVWYARGREHLVAPWRQVMEKPLAVSALIVLLFYVLIGFLDSMHFKRTLEADTPDGEVRYAANIESMLDYLLDDIRKGTEKTYSAPFATHLYNKETLEDSQGNKFRRFPPLIYGGMHLDSPEDITGDVMYRLVKSLVIAMVIWGVFMGIIVWWQARRRTLSFKVMLGTVWYGGDKIPWRSLFATVGFIIVILVFLLNTAGAYHVFGTDKVGEDVLYQAIKSIRTGLVIGTLTTLMMLPFAVLFGTMAGYFRGWVDDVIQYVYTTLSSIPDILLIAAAVLMMQVYMQTHPESFGTGVERSDFRLLFLCMILGVTGWTGLCRLLRAETLKLANLEYVEASRALGTGWFMILVRHIVPNVMHLILITVVLQFSGLVLAEAVLSYLNIGVDPTMYSWGNMINVSRLELAREPIVWWSFLAAFIFMFVLVLSANLFADAVRDAFDPRLRSL